MAMTDKAAPYVNRLIDDRELQRDFREAISALRGGYGRAEKKKTKPTRLLGDKRFKHNAQRAAASLKDATQRFRGEPPKSHRGRKVLLVLVVVAGAAAVAAKGMLGEDEYAAVPQSQVPG